MENLGSDKLNDAYKLLSEGFQVANEYDFALAIKQIDSGLDLLEEVGTEELSTILGWVECNHWGYIPRLSFLRRRDAFGRSIALGKLMHKKVGSLRSKIQEPLIFKQLKPDPITRAEDTLSSGQTLEAVCRYLAISKAFQRGQRLDLATESYRRTMLLIRSVTEPDLTELLPYLVSPRYFRYGLLRSEVPAGEVDEEYFEFAKNLSSLAISLGSDLPHNSYVRWWLEQSTLDLAEIYFWQTAFTDAENELANDSLIESAGWLLSTLSDTSKEMLFRNIDDTRTLVFHHYIQIKAESRLPDDVLAIAKTKCKLNRVLHGPSAPGTVNAMYDLVEIHNSDGSYSEAEAVINRILDIQREQKNRAGEVDALLHLGCTHIRAGDYAGASYMLSLAEERGNGTYDYQLLQRLYASLMLHFTSAMSADALRTQQQFKQLVDVARAKLPKASSSEVAEPIENKVQAVKVRCDAIRREFGVIQQAINDKAQQLWELHGKGLGAIEAVVVIGPEAAIDLDHIASAELLETSPGFETEALIESAVRKTFARMQGDPLLYKPSPLAGEKTERPVGLRLALRT